MLQQVSQVVIREDAEEPAATGRVPGKLEIDEGRKSVRGDEDIGLLGKIVVDDAARMQLP